MTTVNTILISMFFVFSNKIHAQDLVVEICSYQSSHLIFPALIIYADVGDSENYIFQYTNNILRLKGRKTGRLTNLTVITDEENYYSFEVVYKENPRLNYFIEEQMRLKNLSTNPVTAGTRHTVSPTGKKYKPPSNAKPKNMLQNPEPRQDPTLKTVRKGDVRIKGKIDLELYNKSLSLLNKPNLYDFIGAKHGDIRLKVTGIYHDENHCFIVYNIQNKGAIPYDISYIEFGVKEKRRPKKSALNEKILQPVFIAKGKIKRVAARRLNSNVAVFEKLAIPEGKQLYMEVVEKGRNITLDIPYNKLRIEFLK